MRKTSSKDTCVPYSVNFKNFVTIAKQQLIMDQASNVLSSLKSDQQKFIMTEYNQSTREQLYQIFSPVLYSQTISLLSSLFIIIDNLLLFCNYSHEAMCRLRLRIFKFNFMFIYVIPAPTQLPDLSQLNISPCKLANVNTPAAAVTALQDAMCLVVLIVRNFS